MQLFEHLHPEDVPEHLQEASRVLKPGGGLPP
jgi:ubiquinone/menaquinone biosynthesis C-methylase UbiE